jgi:hypothetical protein
MYFHGGKSLKRLCAFIDGYLGGAAYQASGKWEDMKVTGHEDLQQFNSWVGKELGFSSSTRGYENMIFSKVSSDEDAYEMFFQLLDKFREPRSPRGRE